MHVRPPEEDLNRQVLGPFDRIKITGPKVRGWFARVLPARVLENQIQDEKQAAQINCQLTAPHDHKDRLLNLRLIFLWTT